MGYKILSKKELCPHQFEITIDAPYVVRNAKAGQFIIFRADENSERVPLTIADVDKEIPLCFSKRHYLIILNKTFSLTVAHPKSAVRKNIF